MQLNTVEIAKILGYGGEIAAAEITEVSTDSLKVGAGTLFVALKGERFDGHDFIREVLDKGAAAVAEYVPAGTDPARVIVVEDTLKAFGKLGQYNRRQFKGTLIALTGSSGKTTVKEELKAVLSRFAPKDQVNDLYCGDCDKIYCAAPGYFKKETISSNDPLYYSSLELTVTEEDQNRELLFASSHYKVLVEVAGVPAESNLSIEVCGVLPYTNFENKAGGNPVDYKLDTEYSDGQFNALSNIMRHSDHSAVDVCVRDVNGNEIAKINLAEFLRANPEIDCSKQ